MKLEFVARNEKGSESVERAADKEKRRDVVCAWKIRLRAIAGVLLSGQTSSCTVKSSASVSEIRSFPADCSHGPEHHLHDLVENFVWKCHEPASLRAVVDCGEREISHFNGFIVRHGCLLR